MFFCTGILIIRGERESPIVLTTVDGASSWKGLKFYHSLGTHADKQTYCYAASNHTHKWSIGVSS